MKKILFVVCTHGDELAGHKLFQDYPYGQTDKVEWEVFVGNPEAVSFNTRFIETDLNRSFDARNPTSYEEKRAELIKLRLQQYDEVYDIHTTRSIHPSSWDDCIFINHSKPEILEACRYINAPHIIWNSDQEYAKRYLTYHHPFALTLEYQKTYDVYSDYERILADFENIIHQEMRLKKQKIIYEASRGVTQQERGIHGLEFEDFRYLTRLEKKQLELPANEDYVPVFVNQTETDADFYCFLTRKIKEI